MNIHSKAKLTARSRAEMIHRILELGQPVEEVAAGFGISARTAYKWLARFRAEGLAGLHDRSSRPHGSPRTTEEAEGNREAGGWASPTASASPACWRCAGASCRASRSLAPPSSPRPPSPGSCAATASIASPRSSRLCPSAATSARSPANSSTSTSKNSPASCAQATLVTGNRQRDHTRGAGWEFLHIAIDDHSRLAFADLFPDQTARSAIAFLHAALAFFERHGVKAQRIYSDNGSCYRAHAMRNAAAVLGLKHRFTKPYTPKTNGKAERFIQTSLREWAYAHAYSHSLQRSERLPLFLHNYNWHRPHHSLKLKAPVSRLRLHMNNLLSLHS